MLPRDLDEGHTKATSVMIPTQGAPHLVAACDLDEGEELHQPLGPGGAVEAGGQVGRDRVAKRLRSGGVGQRGRLIFLAQWF